MLVWKSVYKSDGRPADRNHQALICWCINSFRRCYRQWLFFFFAERQRQQKMGVILRYWSVLKYNSHHHKTKTLTPYYTNESSNQFQASAYWLSDWTHIGQCFRKSLGVMGSRFSFLVIIQWLRDCTMQCSCCPPTSTKNCMTGANTLN